MKSMFIATLIAAALSGTAFAQDGQQHGAPAAQKKAAPAKSAKAAPQHDHDACPMMQGGMMGMGGMGMMGGGHDAAAHAAMEKRLEQMEKRLDLMQALIERRLKQEPAAK